MAKVTGPLFSVTASGQFAKTLVYANRLGANVVRNLVTPSNPRSTAQTTQRNAQRVAAAGMAEMNALTMLGEARTITDKASVAAIAPSGQRWNSYFISAILGAGNVNFDAATTAYNALLAGEKTAWDTAAAALTPAMPAVAQKVAVTNLDGTPIQAGQAWFYYQYGLYILGIASLPGGTPPTYA